MKSRKMLAILVLALGLIAFQARVSEAAEMGTAFTYQGHLYDANYVANDIYDFQFKLYDANVGGSKVGGEVNKPDVDVIDAYFTVELDFNDANAFNGDARWLEIGVRPGEMNDPNVYTTLSPRQEVTPTPYALYAKTAGGDNDWMVSGNDMYSIPSGNVGIGTTNPGTKLDVQGGDINTSGKIKEGGNNLIPSGAVMFFNLSSCPCGWSEVTTARGRYLVGKPSGGTLAGTQGTALTDLENRAVGKHKHTLSDPGHSHSIDTSFDDPPEVHKLRSYEDTGHGTSCNTEVSYTGITINDSGDVEGTNAPYTQLLVCQKDRLRGYLAESRAMS